MLKKYFKKKSKFGIATDIFFILLLIAILTPQGRMFFGVVVNKIKMVFVEPSMDDTEDMVSLADADYRMLFKSLDGKDIDVSQYKGKVIFLNIWATWCPPCVAEMPDIQELYDKYKDNSEVAFFIVSNEEEESVRKFVNKNNYSFPVYTNDYRFPKAFETTSIPTTFVISKSGKIVIKEQGASNWSGEKMEAAMNQLINE